MIKSFNKSFNAEFSGHLEYVLCAVFAKCEDEELNRFWCDGVSCAPFYNAEVNKDYLSFEKVEQRGYIETTAWMGVSGQEIYQMKIKLGEKSLRRYEKQESLIDCIPSDTNADWIEIDTEDGEIEICLL